MEKKERERNRGDCASNLAEAMEVVATKNGSCSSRVVAADEVSPAKKISESDSTRTKESDSLRILQDVQQKLWTEKEKRQKEK